MKIQDIPLWEKDKHGGYILRVEKMRGRTIKVVPLPIKGHNILCADCNRIARFVIIEDDGVVWYYCGKCSIGG